MNLNSLIHFTAMVAAFSSPVFFILALVPPEGVEDFVVVDENVLARRRARAKESPLVDLLMPLVRLIALRIKHSGMDPKKRAELAGLLTRADYPWGLVPEEFLGLCWTAAIVTFLFLYVFTAIAGSLLPVFPLLMAVLAYFLVEAQLKSWIRRKQWTASVRIPYALDLLTLTMEAGSTFLEAVEQIVQDEPDAPFNRDLAILHSEVRLGTSRHAALMALAARVDIDWFYGVVSAILQGEELGVPIAQILKAQSDLIRQKRSQRAERLGEEAPVKMVLPSMLVMLSVLLIFMGPAIVRWWRGEYAI